MKIISSFSEEIKRFNNILRETGTNFLSRIDNASVSSIFYYHELLRRNTIAPEQRLVTSKCTYPRDEKRAWGKKKGGREKKVRRKQSISYVVVAEWRRDAFPSGIDIAYQRRNRNRHARREADTRARIQRRRKFMPVPCRRRQAYDVPSTVSRGVLADLLSLSPRPLPLSPLSVPPHSPASPPPPFRSLDRSPERRSFLPVSRCLRTESRFLRVTQPSVGRPLIIFPRAAVPEFLNGSWMKPVLHARAAGSLPPYRFPPRQARGLSASVELYPDGAGTPRLYPRIPLAISLPPSLPSSSPPSRLPRSLRRHRICLPVLVLAAETITAFFPSVPRPRRTLPP